MDVCKVMDNAIMAGAGPLGYDPEISLEGNVARLPATKRSTHL